MTIEDIRSRDYSDTFLLTANHRKSKLRAAVMEEKVKGKDFTVERLTNPNDEMSQVNARHATTTVSSMLESRRVGHLISYIRTYMIDDEDKLRQLVDPTSPYMTDMVGEFNRTLDGVIIKQLLENALTGETGSGTQALGSGQVIAHNSTGLTLDKLKNARQIFSSADVYSDDEEFYLAVNSKGMEDLMTDAGVTSIDNVNFKTNESGRIETRLAGFKLIEINGPLNSYAGTGSGGLAASTNRPAIAFTKSALKLGIGQDLMLTAREMPSHNLNTGLFLKGTFGAVRTEEVKVVDIRFQE